MIWLACAAYLHVRPRHQRWSTSKAAYLALAGYGSSLINPMVVKVCLAGSHSSSSMAAPGAAMEAAISQCRWLAAWI